MAKQLSAREPQVLELVATEALSQRQVAERLGLAEATVGGLMLRARLKMGASSTLELVVNYWRARMGEVVR